MTAAQVEELLDEAILQDLEFAPPCELKHIHLWRGIPLSAAELYVITRVPCHCEPPASVLMCKGCDEWLHDHCDGRCTVCGQSYPWCRVVVERRPL